MALSRLQVPPGHNDMDYEVLSPPQNMARSVAQKRYHFIGAGGIGMSGLARLLVRNDCMVTGSDMEDTAVINQLRSLGACISKGHDSANMPDNLEAVVISAAVKDDNPELVEARRRGCTVYKYAEMLGELMDCYDGLAVCGTHGKSTTSGWLACLLAAAGTDPSFIVGAEIPQLGCSSRAGGSDLFVAEACEYDRSFLNLHPKVCVMLNIEQDHLDYYRNEDEIVGAFTEFARGIKTDGVIVANGDDHNVSKVLDALDADISCVTFGLSDGCDFTPANIVLEGGLPSFDVCRSGSMLGRTRISVPGEHNILNALAVVAAAVTVGIDPKVVLDLLGGFTGIDRRLMLKTQTGGVTVLDDYAHHPTEIRASLAAIRQRYAPQRIWCVFQPHQYSRTRFLLDDFAESFTLADITIVPEIYFVRDTAESRQTVNARVLVDRICANGSKALYINDFPEICEHLKNNVRPGDLIVTMGAGNIWKVADEYIQWLAGNSQD